MEDQTGNKDGRGCFEVAARARGGGEVHVYPTWGRGHENCAGCWCHPYLNYKDPDTGGEVWTHRRTDH